RADISKYIETVDDFAAVGEIRLSKNSVGVEAAAALGEAIVKMTSLRIATLSDIFTGRLNTETPLALKSLCDALQHTTTLSELNFGHNAVGAYADAFVGVIEARGGHGLRVIDLQDQGLAPASGNIVAAALERAAPAQSTADKAASPSSTLRVFIARWNRLEDGSSAGWGAAFAAHRTLTAIHLERACLRAQGFQNVVLGLASCPNLRYLNLDDNLGAEVDGLNTWPDFAKSLRRWTKLAFLAIGSCCLDNEGLELILDVFREGRHTKLVTLALDNDFDPSVYPALQEVIADHLPALKQLGLIGNEEVEEGDNDNVEEIRTLLKARGGELVTDDEHTWPLPVDQPDEVPAAPPAAAAPAKPSAPERALSDPALPSKIASGTATVDELEAALAKLTV
ncbi:hypothetical protein BKA62DRAFT_627833, partial [Auriculariales sp. MPI-PUGE-AT-0066]